DDDSQEMLPDTPKPLAVTKKRRRSPSPARVNIHSVALSLFEDYQYYVNEYKRICWHFLPIHQVALSEEHVRPLLCYREGEQEYSILGLSTFAALALSSLSCGRYDVSEDFFQRARDHLSYLFD